MSITAVLLSGDDPWGMERTEPLVQVSELVAKFEVMAGHVRTIAEEMLTEQFGERCSEYDPDCMCCQRWKALDELVSNPFGEQE